MKKYTIGVDFGSLSARATLTSVGDGKEVAGAESAYRHAVMTERDISGESARDTTALQDADDYLASLGEVVRSVIRDSGISPEEIGALAIDFTASNILPILADGTPLSRLEKFKKNPHAFVKMWKHHGATREAKILTETAKAYFPELLLPYGGIISSEWCFAKIFEVLDKASEVFYAADRFIEAGDWITMMLTGSDKRSACFAGYKALWNKNDGYPSRDLFRMCDERLERVVEEKMPGEVINLGECAGVLNKYGSELTGLAIGTRVSSAIIDAHAALPAAGAVHPGDLMIIMGTSACHILVSDKDLPVAGICGKVLGGVVPGLYAYEAGQTAVGDALAWMIKNCIPESYESKAQKMGIGIFELLDQRAEEIAPGKSGLLAIDWWNGCRSPYADYDLSGMLLGLTLATPPEAIYRAIIEAIAFGTRRIVEEFTSQGLAPRRITVSGGIAKKNSFIMQTLADVLGADIFVSDISQAGAHGSAIYAAVTSGAYASLADASESMSEKRVKIYHPTIANKEIYDLIYREYTTLSEYFGKANGVMKRLRDLASN